MKKLPPFKSGWWSFDLGTYRPHPGRFATYSLFSYDNLPPLSEAQFKGRLQWLETFENEYTEQEMLTLSDDSGSEEDGEWTDEVEDGEAGEEGLTERLQKIVSQARQLGLSLPDPFVQLMMSADLQARIPSCTACYFDLPEQIVPCPGSEEGYIIRFLDDQQWCLLWYLYITPEGEHCVLVSPICLEEISDPASAKEVVEAIFVCAPSFEEFLYRFWLENKLWFKLNQMNEQSPLLSREEEHYLAHYK